MRVSSSQAYCFSMIDSLAQAHWRLVETGRRQHAGRKNAFPLDTHLGAARGLELDQVFVDPCASRRDQFDERRLCRLAPRGPTMGARDSCRCRTCKFVSTSTIDETAWPCRLKPARFSRRSAETAACGSPRPDLAAKRGDQGECHATKSCQADTRGHRIQGHSRHALRDRRGVFCELGLAA